MRVLALTRYDALGASSRLRLYQYERCLGLDIQILAEPFFDDRYLHALYAGTGSAAGMAGYFLKRLSALLRPSQIDVIWLEKEALPWVPWLIERLLLRKSIPLIVDYDDAIFHRYDMHGSSIVRSLLGKKIDAVMRRADLVIAGNSYLAERAWTAGAARVEVIPTVVDLERYPAAGLKAVPVPVVIGWIGSPSTAPYLAPVSRLLADLAGRHPIACVAIGAREDQVLGSPFIAKEWSESQETKLLQGLDIGIMPLPDEPWTRGKCGYKLIQYMACGLPVVASPVGVNTRIIRHGENGFLASTDAEWEQALTRLISSQDVRRRMGAAGRRRVEQEFSLQVQAPRLEHLFRSIAA